MYFFDLHCDTITRLNTGERLEPGDRSLRRNGAHIDLERMEGLSWCQCFAVFMPDGLRGRAAIDYYEQNLRFFRAQLAANKDLSLIHIWSIMRRRKALSLSCSTIL